MSFSLYSHNSLCGVKFAALMTRTVKIGVECPNPVTVNSFSERQQ